MPKSRRGIHQLAYDSTPAERRLTLLIAAFGVAGALACGTAARVDWATWQWGIVLFVAFDVVGGVAAMPLPPAIRKVRPADEPLRPIAFAAFHIHPLLLALVLPDQPWIAMFLVYGSALAGVALANLVPGQFRTSVALAWCTGAITLAFSTGPFNSLEWFPPAFLLKLVGSHSAPNGGAR